MLGPLFWKELLEMARRPRYFVARTAVGLALLVGVCIALQGRTVLAGNRNIAQLAEIGQSLYLGWAFWVMIGVALLVPAVVSGLVAGEKDGRTLEILLTTCLHPREILAGKIASRLLFVGVLILSSVPALGFASLYGGFSARDVLNASIVHAACAALAASAGLYYSTISQKPYIALIRTYIALGMLWYVVPAMLPSTQFLNPQRALAAGFQTDAALFARGSMLFRGRGAAPPTAYFGLFSAESLPILQFTVLNLIASVLLFFRCTAMLRRCAVPGRPPLIYRIARGVYGRLVGDATTFVEQRQQSVGMRQLWIAELWTRSLNDRWRSSLGDRNPIGLRNATANVYDPEKYVAAFQIVVWVALIGGIATSSFFGWNPFDRLLYAIVLPAASILLLLTSLVLSASALSRERQYGSWELLLLADVPPRRLLNASVRGVLWTLWPLWLIAGGVVLLYGVANQNFAMAAGWAVTFTPMLLQVLSIGLLVSIQNTRIAPAISKSLGWVGAIAVAGPLLLRLVGPGNVFVSLLVCWLALFIVWLIRRERFAGGVFIVLVPLTFAAAAGWWESVGLPLDEMGRRGYFGRLRPDGGVLNYLEIIAPGLARWGGYGGYAYSYAGSWLALYQLPFVAAASVSAIVNFAVFRRLFRNSIRH